MRLSARPVVTERDLGVLRRRAVEVAIQHTAKQFGLALDAAAARLYGERFPRTPLPEGPEAVREALMEKEPSPAAQVAELAAHRLEQMRAKAKQLGVDPDRMPALEPEARAEAAFTGIELGLLSPPKPGRPGLLDRLRGLGRSTPSRDSVGK